MLLFLACNDQMTRSSLTVGIFQNVYDTLSYFLDTICIRFWHSVAQIVGIHMGTNCASLVENLFLFYYERYFRLSLSDDTQYDIIEAFNAASRSLGDSYLIVMIYTLKEFHSNLS